MNDVTQTRAFPTLYALSTVPKRLTSFPFFAGHHLYPDKIKLLHLWTDCHSADTNTELPITHEYYLAIIFVKNTSFILLKTFKPQHVRFQINRARQHQTSVSD